MLGMMFWDIAGPYGIWKLYRLEVQRQELYQKNVELVKLNTKLRNNLARLEHDRQYQEEVVRKELGWVRDGEILYQFVGKDK